MGILQKKTVEHSQNFTLGNTRTLVIVGLGNIGKEYDSTRHNIGFECIDALHDSHSEFTSWQVKKNLFCNFSSGTFSDTKVILIKPTTFMNDSGRAIQEVLNFYKLSTKQLVVVHDELDIPFGQIRTRYGGGHAGHNGIKSIIQYIGDDFSRVRIGIDGADKPSQQDSSDYVLSKFNKTEQEQLTKLIRETQSILIEYIYRGELYPDTRNFLL